VQKYGLHIDFFDKVCYNGSMRVLQNKKAELFKKLKKLAV
jgi:hypothetical protein